MPPRRNTLRNVLIIVGVLVVLCCGGAAIGGVFLVRAGLSAIKPAQDATDAFVTDLESGNYSDAYGRLCARSRSEFTQDQFSRGVQTLPHIRSHRLTGAWVSNVNGHTSATVSAELTQDGGFVDHHTFPLVKEGDAWKVCGEPY